MEPYGDGDSICLRSHLHKYLAVDQFGNVTCENEEKDDTAKFEISVCDDYSGRWAFRSVARGYFLGASSDALVCSAKSPGDPELWYVHLAARPQVNLRSVGRKRFARLSEEQTEIQVGQVLGGDSPDKVVGWIVMAWYLLGMVLTWYLLGMVLTWYLLGMVLTRYLAGMVLTRWGWF